LAYSLVFTISSGWIIHVAHIPDTAPKKYGFTGAMTPNSGVNKA